MKVCAPGFSFGLVFCVCARPKPFNKKGALLFTAQIKSKYGTHWDRRMPEEDKILTLVMCECEILWCGSISTLETLVPKKEMKMASCTHKKVLNISMEITLENLPLFWK